MFALDDVHESDAFGARWTALDPVYAEELWREPAPKVGSIALACSSLAAAWAVKLGSGRIPKVDTAERIWVAGPSAVT